METTVSVFEAHYIKAVAIRQERMMDMGQSVQFGMATQEGKRQIWNSWSRTVDQVRIIMNNTFTDTIQKALFIWNGQAIDKSTMISNFKKFFGRRSVE